MAEIVLFGCRMLSSGMNSKRSFFTFLKGQSTVGDLFGLKPEYGKGLLIHQLKLEAIDGVHDQKLLKRSALE